MRKGKGLALVAVALTVVVGLALALGACGSSSPSGGSSPAASKIEQILGHAPTGIAKQIADKGVIVIADDSNYAPQSSIDKSGNLVGFDVDVGKKVAEILGVTPKFVNPNWDSIPTGLKVGRFDVSIGSMTVTADRKKSLDFTEPYYYTTGQLMIRRGGTPITSVDQLKGKTVGVGAQTTYFYFLQKLGGVNVKAYTTDADAFPDLANGRLDAVMSAGPTEQEAIAQGKPFELTGAPLYYEDLAFAIRKGEPDFLGVLNYAVEQMHKDGSLSAMSKQWYHSLDLTVKQ